MGRARSACVPILTYRGSGGRVVVSLSRIPGEAEMVLEQELRDAFDCSSAS